MFLNTSATNQPSRKGLNPRRMARTVASAATSTLVEQARRLRFGHASFLLGLTIAVAAAASLGAFESGASRVRPQDSRPTTRGITVSKIAAAPLNIVIVDSQAEANLLLAEAYHLHTEGWGSVALPTVRVITSTVDEHLLHDEVSMMVYHEVTYRITDLRAN